MWLSCAGGCSPGPLRCFNFVFLGFELDGPAPRFLPPLIDWPIPGCFVSYLRVER